MQLDSKFSSGLAESTLCFNSLLCEEWQQIQPSMLLLLMNYLFSLISQEKKKDVDVLSAPPTESLQTELLLLCSAEVAAKQTPGDDHPHQQMFPDSFHLPCKRGMLPHHSRLCTTSPVHPVVELGPAMALHGARRENEAQKYINEFLK